MWGVSFPGGFRFACPREISVHCQDTVPTGEEWGHCQLLPEWARSPSGPEQQRGAPGFPLSTAGHCAGPCPGLPSHTHCPSYCTAHSSCASIICSRNWLCKTWMLSFKKTLWTEQIPNRIAKASRAVIPGQPWPVIHFHNEQKECWLILHVRIHSSHNWSWPISPDLGWEDLLKYQKSSCKRIDLNFNQLCMQDSRQPPSDDWNSSESSSERQISTGVGFSVLSIHLENK